MLAAASMSTARSPPRARALRRWALQLLALMPSVEPDLLSRHPPEGLFPSCGAGGEGAPPPACCCAGSPAAPAGTGGGGAPPPPPGPGRRATRGRPMRAAPTGPPPRRVDACLYRCVARALLAATVALPLLAS